MMILKILHLIGLIAGVVLLCIATYFLFVITNIYLLILLGIGVIVLLFAILANLGELE